jgi:hypothetical protein
MHRKILLKSICPVGVRSGHIFGGSFSYSKKLYSLILNCATRDALVVHAWRQKRVAQRARACLTAASCTLNHLCEQGGTGL